MAQGFPTAYALSIDFTGTGVFVDVTADVDFETGIAIRYGRSNEFEDVQPGWMTFTLRNEDGKYTPDNPVSSFWPNVTERKAVTFTVTKGLTRTRYKGYTASWVPTVEDPNDASVAVTCVTIDGIRNRKFYSGYTERVIFDSRFGIVDVYAMTGDDKANGIENLGSGKGTARLVKAATTAAKRGSGSVSTADDVFLEGCYSFEPSDAHVGPVWLMTIDPAIVAAGTQQVGFWFRTEELVGATGPYNVATGFDAAGNQLWALKMELVSGQTDLSLWNASDALVYSVVAGVNDGRWRHFFLNATGVATSDVANVDEDGGTGGYFTSPTGFGIKSTAYVLFGGKGNIKANGKQTKCGTWQLAGPYATSVNVLGRGGYGGPSYGGYASALNTANDLALFAGASLFFTGSDFPNIVFGKYEGETLWSGLQKIARTVGGMAYQGPPNGNLVLRSSDSLRTASIVGTITIGDDDDRDVAPMVLAREIDSIPTRARVSSPDGDVVVIDTTREATGDEAEISLDTWAKSTDDARYPGQQALAASGALRIKQLGVSMVSSVADLYNLGGLIYPGAKIRIASTPTTALGYSYFDVIVQGWTETYALDDCTMVFDFTPADEPAEAVVEDAEYGRVSGEGSVLTAAITSSATSLTVTPPAGQVYSTAAGDYPMDLVIDGERVTVPSAPASGAAPSWTGVTRGVAPTVAVAHAINAPVDVWHAASVAPV